MKLCVNNNEKTEKFKEYFNLYMKKHLKFYIF